MYVPSIYILWTSSKQVCTKTCISCTCLYNVCTMYVQCIYLSEPGSFHFILSHIMNLQFLSMSAWEAFPWWMPFVRAWTPFVIGIDNAMVQEFAFLYIQCIYPLKTALAGSQLSCSIFWKTRTSAFEHGSTVYEQCILMSVHENMKMPQESWPPARAILREYRPVWTLHIQKCWFLYTSIVQHCM
jgi:hypothetical protein